MITSFDLFGTLVEAPRPQNPASAIAAALEARDVPIPDDWPDAFSEYHLDLPEGAELSLPEHTEAALASRGINPNNQNPLTGVNSDLVARAVFDAFDPRPVTTRESAIAAVDVASERGDVAILSNCTVPNLVSRTLEQSTLDEAHFDAVVSSVECGWRKPDPHAFEAVTDRLDGSLDELVHVGDDPQADGGADAVGATSVLVSETPLTDLPAVLEGLR
ncbi:HAD family hydrolase [Haladaptatus sp. AB643]|uniref:HAD family hydrolase n=1 Tax=Haladaptatus sp. AB643 TaxID=2934174 RepID=UPI00209C177E|nr:HAD family hydrolase [Haladaptatus sp. AB643]MCO8245453.1 HAD family hydrolase [Haladaptatus sp. AB643]